MISPFGTSIFIEIYMFFLFLYVLLNFIFTFSIKKKIVCVFLYVKKNTWFFVNLKIKKKPFPQFTTFSPVSLTGMPHRTNFALPSIPPPYIHIYYVPPGTTVKSTCYGKI